MAYYIIIFWVSVIIVDNLGFMMDEAVVEGF